MNIHFSFDHLDEFLCDPTFSATISSTICNSLKCEGKVMVAGIDEAGRGPVLGPMVYSIFFYCEDEWERLLVDTGICKDSKALKESERECLFEYICKNQDKFGFISRVISPQEISTRMLQANKFDLNQISHSTAINLIKQSNELLNEINPASKVNEIYVDTVGDPKKYQIKIASAITNASKIVVSPKADSKFTSVSAASIVSKVLRDRILKCWKFHEITDENIPTCYGSGYTSDSQTINWLKSNIDTVFGFPSFVRFSWSTASKLIEEHSVKVAWNDAEESEGEKASSSLSKSKKRKYFDTVENGAKLFIEKQESNKIVRLYEMDKKKSLKILGFVRKSPI